MFRFYKNDQTMPIVADPPPLINQGGNMLYLSASDYILNTLGYATQLSGILHLTVTPALLAQYNVEQYLDTTCDSICIGSIIPQLGLSYPNTSIEIIMKSSQAPTANATTGGIDMTFYGNLDFQAILENNQTAECFQSSIILSALISNVSVDSSNGYIIKGDIEATNAILTVTSSAIGPIDSGGLSQIFELAVVSIVNGELNEVTQKGIQVPNIPYVQLTNPTIQFMSGGLVIGADAKYTGGL